MISVAKSSKDRTSDNKTRGALISYQEIEPGVGIVSLTGRLDIRSVPQIERVFHTMTALQGKPVIVDLSGVELMNSIGLGMLITAANSLKVVGVPLILLNPQPKVERVIRLACVDQLLPIVYDLTHAIRSVKAA